jgi:hypothetical protein
VKTARFAKVVEKCGNPENHLVLIEPAKDRALQQAVKTHRVMTVMQEVAGSKADRGEVGFEPGPGRQFLVFPIFLRAFAGRAIVGIKYDLLSSPDVPKSQQAAPERPRQPPKAKPEKPEKPKRRRASRASETSKKVVGFEPNAPNEDDGEDEIAELKKQARHAMAVLEAGKPVAAFNLLKRLVDD